MNDYDRYPFDREFAEQLRGAPSASHEVRQLTLRLAERLAAAATPTLPGELAGERAAVAAFVAAVPSNSVGHARRTPTTKGTLAKLLTVKAAAVLAAVSAGGIALAASTGVLPSPFNHEAPAPVHATPDGTPERGVGTEHPAAGTPSPSLEGLCTAFLADAREAHGKSLDSPAFAALVEAAGGKDAVDSFCSAIIAAHGSPEATHPTGPPATHPGNTPTSHPDASPTAHAKGTDHPGS